MASATVTQRLRPLRVGFLVNPADSAALLRSIQLSTMLWGGIYNPIVPLFPKRLPRRWSPHPGDRTQTPDSIATGYLDGFDPDLIVCVGFSRQPTFQAGNRKVISEAALVGEFPTSGRPGYGIGVYEVAAHLAETEFKFLRKEPLNVALPLLSKPHGLFLAAVFGSLPGEIAALIRTNLGGRLGITDQTYAIATLTEHLTPRNVFPRRIGIFGLRGHLREPTVYCMDAASSLDLIDFWNLRAAGFTVIAAPKQLWTQPELCALIREFVDRHYQPHRHNPEYYFHATVQVGRSLELAEVQRFIESLNISPSETVTQPRLVTRPWYPRLWDRWARENTPQRPEPTIARERETSVRETDQVADLRTLDPPFDELPPDYTGNACFVNEIDYSVYGATDPVAEVLPEGSHTLARRFAPASLDEFRLARTGLTFLAEHSEQRIFFQVPRAEELMVSWLADLGWKAELSAAGRVAKQMLRRLGGVSGVNLLNHAGVIKLLDQYASEKVDDSDQSIPKPPRWIGEEDLRGKLARILTTDQRPIEPDRFIRMLVERQAIRLGLELHCPTCLRWLWRPVDELDYEIECEHCLTSFAMSSAPSAERKWSYKPTGPFNARDYAAGSYAVLLTLQFFARNHHHATTPLLSFKATKNNNSLEADLALFYDDGSWRSAKQELIFAECKSFGTFEDRDIDRMTALSQAFPGSVLVFAKLGETFDDREVRRLARFANSQRREYAAHRIYSPVLLLTGTELLSFTSPPRCWMNKGQKYDAAARQWRFLRTLRDHAEASQTLYLGLPDLTQWMVGRRAHRRKKAPAAIPVVPQPP
jgi:hypothetical protein